MRDNNRMWPSPGVSAGPTPAASAGGASRTGAAASPAADSFARSPPSISLPKGGGAIRGMGEKFSANPVTGTGSMSVPIAASPGRGGFGPQLSLAYDSGAGNGPFGLGWSLSVPSITRKTDKGLPRYLDAIDSDTFLLAGAEDLVRTADGGGSPLDDQHVVVYGRRYAIRSYRPRVEGLFALIERWSDDDDLTQTFWRTVTRDNVTSWFGRSAASRVLDPDEPSHIFQWMLCETYDDKGNAAEYRYRPEDGAGVDFTRSFEANRTRRTRQAAITLESIRYGNRVPFMPSLAAGEQAWPTVGSGQADWMFELVFDYSTPATGALQPAPVVQAPWSVRQDPFSSHRAGFEVRSWRLCHRVLMLHHFPDDPDVGLGCLVRSTDFAYAEPPAPDDAAASAYAVLQSVTQTSWQRRSPTDTVYESRSLPPVAFSYSRAELDTTAVRTLAAEQLPQLPVGVQAPGWQWVDLDGEGLSGVLTEQGGAWMYAPNRGAGRFGPARPVAQVPALAALAGGRQQLMDLAGSGQIDLVDFSGPVPGFHEREADQGWKRHVPFASLPNIDWQDPNLRFIDLTGDGHADALVTEDDVFTWYPSLEERGFDTARRSRQAPDDDIGPRLVFDDGTQTLFLADMCGDGLTDIVRIRNGQACYWPNLGHGRFGRKVTMADAPWFDAPDLFEPQRIRLADIDGSGPTDLVYLGRDGARLYINRSGNSFGPARSLPLPVATENLAAVQVADLMGNGTACLVWNSHLPADSDRPVRFIELTGGIKPHLLVQVTNNLGATTTIEYTPSTHYYLHDLAAGTPWVTRLPFPVHCVSRITEADLWRGTSFTSSTSYHHGHFDGSEREFRGFGRVEQTDTETFSDPQADQAPVKTITWYHTGAAIDRQRILGHLAQEYFPQRFAARLTGPAQADRFFERPLPEPELPSGLDAKAWQEAHRACKGMVLRQEVYELDPASRAPVRLFTAATHNCRIRQLQPRGNQLHAVFHVTASEALTYHYELALPPGTGSLSPDPRIGHTINLRHNEYGNPEQSVSIGYGRWRTFDYPQLPRPELAHEVQAVTHIVYSEVGYTRDVQLDATGQPWQATSPSPLRHRRLRLPCETQTFELKAIPRTGPRYFSPQDFTPLDLSTHYGHQPGEAQPSTPVADKPHHDLTEGTVPQRRLVEHLRTRWFDDHSEASPPTAALPFGQHGPRGLKYEDAKLALTPALLQAVFGSADTADPLADKLAWPLAAADATPAMTPRSLLQDPQRSGYVDGAEVGGSAGDLWMRSGVAGFDPQAARAFYLPDRFTDAFGNPTRITYGPEHLFIQRLADAAGNAIEVTRFDRRVLAPSEMRDASGNASEVAFDILGLPVAMALKGKQIGGAWEGDHLDGWAFDQLNPPAVDVAAFCTAASLDEARARRLLGTATSRFVYHHGETRDAQGRPTWLQRLAGACAISRETHVSRLAPAALTRLQVALECSDGHGAVMMSKAQAEPEMPGGPPRWVVNGLTVLNNKGKPVRQFEPTFSSRFGCERPADNGVSPTIFYDALGRVVRTDLPDGTLTRAVFTPWHAEAWDANDTVLESRWLSEQGRSSLPLAERLRLRPDGLVRAEPEARAGWLSRHHAETPARTVLDSLGREVITIAHNRIPSPTGALRMADRNWRDQYITTYAKLDAEGKPLWIRDGRGNLVMQYITAPKPTRWDDQPHEQVPAASHPAYDLAGNLLYQHSMDAGDRWMLMDAAGQPLLAWDSNERDEEASSGTPAMRWKEQRLYRTEYDMLRRPRAQWLHLWRRDDAAPATAPFAALPPVMLERSEYQDAVTPDPTNLNGQAVRQFDASGLVQTVRRSFAGPVEEVHRRLVADPRTPWVDWQPPPVANDTRLEADTYRQITEHDALGRMTRLYNWHRAGAPVAVYEPRYNERGLLRSESLRVRAAKTALGYEGASGTAADAIRHIAYNAKGQKTLLHLDNGTVTRYSYDPRSFRLTQIYTRRDYRFSEDCGGPPPRPHSAAPDVAAPPRPCGVQNLHYVYDAVGNITHIRDDAQPTIFFANAAVEPSSDYAYDALDRLVQASGREQAGNPGSARTPEGSWPSGPVPGNTSLRRYVQRYRYDEVGNFVSFRHSARGGNWTRWYATADDSNRLLRTWEGDDDWGGKNAKQKVEYRYDPHGSMLNLTAAPSEFHLRWDHRDMVRHIGLGGGGNAWYQYDSGKQRTRKWIERMGDVSEERLYLGGYERYRRKNSSGRVVEEVESHHLFEGEQRVLLVDDVLLAADQLGPGGMSLSVRTCWRYQYGNHLGSVGVELDEQSRVISHEELHPYGTSAYRRMNEGAALRAPAMRYRFSGMERDEESGLNCHTARAYIPWIGVWGSPDPAGVAGGSNLYRYAASNPINATDASGLQPVTVGAPDRYQRLGTAAGYIREHWAPTGTVSLRLESRLAGLLAPSELERLMNSARNNTVTSLLREDVATFVKTPLDNARTAAAKLPSYVGEAEYLQTVKDTRAALRSTLSTTGAELASVPARVADAYAASIKAEQVGLQYAASGQTLPKVIAPLLRRPVAPPAPSPAATPPAQVVSFAPKPRLAAPPTAPAPAPAPSPAPVSASAGASKLAPALTLGGAALGTAGDIADASASSDALYVTAKVTTAATQATGGVMYAAGVAAAAPEAVAAGSYLAAAGGAASLAVGSVALAVNETSAALEGKETAIHKAVVGADKLRSEGARQGGFVGALKTAIGTVGTGLIVLDFLQGNGIYGAYRY